MASSKPAAAAGVAVLLVLVLPEVVCWAAAACCFACAAAPARETSAKSTSCTDAGVALLRDRRRGVLLSRDVLGLEVAVEICFGF